MGAVMFFSPIACAQSMRVVAKPAHPCCPKSPTQIPTDCVKPLCIFIEAKPLGVEALSNVDHKPVVTAEIGTIVERPHGVPWDAVPDRISLAQDHRYLTLHQLLL